MSDYSALIDDPILRLWTYSLGATLLISVFPFFILTFIPIKADPNANSSMLKVLLALGAGGLLGDAFLHLIPHAQLASSDGGHSHDHGHSHAHTHSHSHSHGHSHGGAAEHEPHDMSVGLWVLAGLLVFFIVDKFVRIVRGDDSPHGHSHATPIKQQVVKKKRKAKVSDDEDFNSADDSDHDSHTSSSKRLIKTKVVASVEPPRLKVAAWLNMIADVMHNFTDGLAIGASFTASTAVGIVTLVTVLVHEIPHEIGDFALLVKSGYTKKQAMFTQLITAIGALLGCIVSLWSVDSASLAASAQSSWILPFTAGGFIYIATASVLPELLEKSSTLVSLIEVIAMCSGVALMYAIALFE